MHHNNHHQQLHNLGSYAFAHALVDGVCAAILVGLYAKQYLPLPVSVGLAVSYNVLAFGLQPVIGLIVDRFENWRALAIGSLTMIGVASLLTFVTPYIAVILAGVGNAAFHVAGGSLSLRLQPDKATAPGIFVAPGAVGLVVGAWLGKTGNIYLPIYLGLLLFAVSILISYLPQMNLEKARHFTPLTSKKMTILLTILISISIRSLVGFMVVFPWKSNMVLLIFLTLAIAIGKALGGILADRWGWTKTALMALATSLPCLLLGPNHAWLGIIGMLLFNLTMPITLVATASILKNKPGFAFGLTCLALLLGYSPVVFNYHSFLRNPFLLVVTIFISFLFLYNELRYHSPQFK